MAWTAALKLLPLFFFACFSVLTLLLLVLLYFFILPIS